MSGTVNVNINLAKEHHDRLAELADDSGIPKTRLAALLLAELLPTVSGVRTRLQVIRTSEAGK